MPDVESWIALSFVPVVGPVTFRKLLSLYRDRASVFKATLGELSGNEHITKKKKTL